MIGVEEARNGITRDKREGTRMRGVAGKRDLWAGVLMVAFGLAAVAEGRRLRVGTLTDMGSGYLPLALGLVLAILGVVIASGAVMSREPGDDDHEAIAHPDWRGCIAIVGGITAFVWIGNFFGLAPATFACVFISAMGDRKSTPLGAAVLAAVMTAIAVGLFVMLLQVQFPVWRW